jgi:hypothetical protein
MILFIVPLRLAAVNSTVELFECCDVRHNIRTKTPIVIDFPEPRTQPVTMQILISREPVTREWLLPAVPAMAGHKYLIREAVQMKRYGLCGMILAVCLMIAVCPLTVSAQKSDEASQGGPATEKKETAAAPEDSKMKMEAYKKDLKKELHEMDKKIAALGKKVKKEGSKLEADAKGSWNDLKAKRQVANDKYKRLSSKTKEVWEKTKSEVDIARDDLKKAYDKTASYFK